MPDSVQSAAFPSYPIHDCCNVPEQLSADRWCVPVLETDTGMQTVPADQMPEGARDGDVLQWVHDHYEVDAIATEERRNRILERMRKRKRGRD